MMKRERWKSTLYLHIFTYYTTNTVNRNYFGVLEYFVTAVMHK